MEIKDCSCGKSHYCAVEQVYKGVGATKALHDLVAKFKNALIIADENTLKAFKTAGGNINTDKCTTVVFSGDVVLIPNEKAISVAEKAISVRTDALIGIGGGTINDLCKYIAKTHGLYYIYVATAPSMDGFASDGAALILDGMKVTLKTAPPKIIICDTLILRNAPLELIRAGIGDVLGKFSCLNDWLLAKQIKGEYFCKEIYDRVYECATQVACNIQRILNREETAVALLADALLNVGVEMSYAGSSRPASGSEHHMAHFFELYSIEQGRAHQPHGVDVGCASYFTAMIRDAVAATNMHPRFDFDAQAHFGNVKKLLPRAAEEIVKLQEKVSLHGNRAGNYDAEGIKSVLRLSPTAAEMQKMLDAAGLSPQKLLDFYGKETVVNAMKYGKELKDRFTVLWLYEYFGWGMLEL